MNHQELSLLKSELEKSLRPGESLLWFEQPVSKLYNRSIWAALPIGIFWTLISGTALVAFLQPFLSNWNIVSLVPVIFMSFSLLIGIFISSLPFFGKNTAAKVIYGITNERVLILQNFRLKTLKSYGLNQLTNIETNENLDGSGNIIFGKELITNSTNKKHFSSVGFMAISDVQKTMSTLNQVTSEQKKTKAA